MELMYWTLKTNNITSLNLYTVAVEQWIMCTQVVQLKKADNFYVDAYIYFLSQLLVLFFSYQLILICLITRLPNIFWHVVLKVD